MLTRLKSIIKNIRLELAYRRKIKEFKKSKTRNSRHHYDYTEGFKSGPKD